MKVPYTKSGKCGTTVWQRNRFCNYSYPAFIPYNPCSIRQIAIRLIFAAVSKRWRLLTQQQRDLWNAIAWTKWSKPRLGRGRLTGFQYFVKVNVALAHRGQPQVDLPPENPRLSKLPAPDRACPSRFGQPFVGPTAFLQAHNLLESLDHAPRLKTPTVPPPT